MQDDKLLTQYARDGSQAAFSQLVSRHLTLVYATCLRETGSPTQAEDAAQVVFLLLARKAKSLRAAPSLAGWLYNTARFVAKDVRKQEARRQQREQTVMQEITHRQETTTTPEWERVEPLLNNALSALKPAEREAVLLRFLEGHTLAETGAILGLTEDAARMRVTRAVEKMRRYLTAHGTTVTGAVLAALLTSEAARPIPTHAADTITQGTLTAITTGPTPNVLLLSKGVLHTMQIKTATSLAATAAALLTVTLAVASVPKMRVTPRLLQISHQPTLGKYYANHQLPALESLFLPDAAPGQSGMVGGGTPLANGESNLQIATFTSPSSFKAVCQFYTNKLMPPGSHLEALGLRGDGKKQSGYSLDEGPTLSAATFSQRTAVCSISVFVRRGAQDKMTAVTLVYGQS